MKTKINKNEQKNQISDITSGSSTGSRQDGDWSVSGCTERQEHTSEIKSKQVADTTTCQ